MGSQTSALFVQLSRGNDAAKKQKIKNALTSAVEKGYLQKQNQILTFQEVPDTDLRISLFEFAYDFIMDAFMQKLRERRDIHGTSRVNASLLK